MDEKDRKIRAAHIMGVLRGLLSSVAIAILACAAVCCSTPEEGGRRRPTREEFIRYNRHLIRCDSVCIARYSDSLGLSTAPTPTNLWLTVTSEGGGAKIKDGDRVRLTFSVLSLLGDTIYSQESVGVKTVTVGKADINIGLDEALCLLRRGAEATVILIPEKAFGLRGDDDAVRGRMILRYDLKILD